MREAELGKGKSLLSKDAVSDSSFSLTPQGALGHQLHLGWSFLEAKESAFCNPLLPLCQSLIGCALPRYV